MPKLGDRRPAADRFWEKVEKGDDCWLWTAGRDQEGYGRFRATNEKKVLAHRWAWEDFHGPIPAGLLVLHHCDVASCVRPAHLYLGTDKDNMADMVTRARESKHNAKLTARQVARIRSRYDGGYATIRELANEHHVAYRTIWMIVRRKHWRSSA